MFLTQKHPITAISVDGNSDVNIHSEEVIQQNAYVLREIENVLKDYPEYPYQVAFSMDELRAKLVTHVLSHLSTCYSVIGEPPKPIINAQFSYHSKSKRLRLDVLIRGSILHLLRENAVWISRHIQQLDNSLATHCKLSDYNDNYKLN
jgi:hypothetical protein